MARYANGQRPRYLVFRFSHPLRADLCHYLQNMIAKAGPQGPEFVLGGTNGSLQRSNSRQKTRRGDASHSRNCGRHEPSGSRNGDRSNENLRGICKRESAKFFGGRTENAAAWLNREEGLVQGREGYSLPRGFVFCSRVIEFSHALVVQWIEQAVPNGLMSVRFWPRAPSRFHHLLKAFFD